MMQKKTIIHFLIALVLCQLAGVVGSLFTDSISSWYVFLNKPVFNPPSWLFGPVWISLYTLMAVSFTLLWAKIDEGAGARAVLIFFVFHLVLNALWSVLFFGMQNPTLAFMEIIILLLTLIILMIRSWKISRVAVYVLIPYLCWVSFAAVLNYSIMMLN